MPGKHSKWAVYVRAPLTSFCSCVPCVSCVSDVSSLVDMTGDPNPPLPKWESWFVLFICVVIKSEMSAVQNQVKPGIVSVLQVLSCILPCAMSNSECQDIELSTKATCVPDTN